MADGDGSPSLVSSALHTLGEALDGPTSGVATAFDSLTEHCADAVDSLVFVMLTITVDDLPFRLVSSRRSGDAVVTTVSVPLIANETTSCVLVLAASTPHAFMNLAHDAASELGVGADIEHDRHLDVFGDDTDSSVSSLEERSVIDRAIGILIDRGSADTADRARSTLTAEAARTGAPVVDVARRVVESVGVRQPNPDSR